jgi:threonine dehydrogenase-like Zn-dependent dehydrogenase
MRHGWKAIGGWEIGNTIDGCQAEYVRVPDAEANLCVVPDHFSDEQVLICPDIPGTNWTMRDHGVPNFPVRRQSSAAVGTKAWQALRRARRP